MPDSAVPLTPDAPPTGTLPVAPKPPLPPAGHTVAMEWAKANPASATLVGVLLAVLAAFYTLVPLFPTAKQTLQTPLDWIRGAWNPETHYEHGPLVPLIILFLVWNALPKLRGNVARPAWFGLLPILFGVGTYLLGVRALQPRITWVGLPCLLWGGAWYVGGWRVARALLFPLACVFFMIPVPGIDQTTVKMQVLATKAAAAVCTLIGIPMTASGVSLRAVDQSFQFQVIGDCSGINSLMAITLMTAVFAHLTQDKLWKKIVLFSASVPVALIGNLARLTSIMIVAKCFGQQVAGGWFHEVSAYLISFPFAFAALCVVNKLLNWRTVHLFPRGGGGGGAARPRGAAVEPSPAFSGPLTAKPAGYDY